MTSIKRSRRLVPLRLLAKRKELAKDVDIGCNVLDVEDDAEICGAYWLLDIIALSQRHEKPVAAASSRRRLADVRIFQFELVLKFGAPRFQGRLFNRQRLEQCDQLFLGHLV
jgi:hypothetical protein